ncbi:MAG: hypothetical protein V1726_06425 [Methanobacteriota archaeon]
MKKQVIIIGIIALLFSISLSGCNEQSPTSEDETEQLILGVTRVDFKPDFSLDFIDTYETAETQDDINIITIEDIKQHQLDWVADAPDIIMDLLQETRLIDCSNSFEAVKNIWETVRYFGSQYPYQGNFSEATFRSSWSEWLGRQYQDAMIYSLADAQLRNWDTGNWSEILFYPVGYRVFQNNVWCGGESVITSFPNTDGTMTPYITDGFNLGWKKYVYNTSDDNNIIFEFEQENTHANDITTPILESCGLRFNSNPGYFTMYIDGEPKEIYDYEEFIKQIINHVPQTYKNFIYFPANKINDMRAKIYGAYEKIVVQDDKDFNNYKLLISNIDNDFIYYFCVIEV